MLLDGLHLTANDLAAGIKAAIRRPCPQADAYLRVLERASGVRGSKALLAKLKGGWRPSLDDLLDADLDDLALQWMPEGRVEIRLDREVIPISSRHLGKVLREVGAMSSEERQQWVKALVRLQSVIPVLVCSIRR
jgi:hypothetical protein